MNEIGQRYKRESGWFPFSPPDFEQNSADEPALDESTEPEPAPPPTVAEAYKAIDCIRRFTLSSSSEKCEDILRMSEVFEKFVLSETQKRTKQTEITDYFSTD